MMYLLRGLLVSTAVFVLVYALISTVVAACWRPVQSLALRQPAPSFANWLFGLRITPLVFAVIAVGAFAIPSFVRFEPRNSEEGIGAGLLVLAAMFLLLAGSGASRAWRAFRCTARSVRQWSCGRRRRAVAGAVLVTSPDAPPVALAGVTRPTLLVSHAAQSSLTHAELDRTIAHELAHLRARDNLKKLVLHACAFPGMSRLETAWREAIELSADSEAVHSEVEALDLASALIKIARLHGSRPVPALASGLVDGPHSILELRVDRLMHWQAPRSWRRSRMVPAAAFALIVLLACNYSTLIYGVHIITEFLVR